MDLGSVREGAGFRRLGLKSDLVFVLLIMAVAAGAFAFRLPFLSERPMHGDEAVQASKAGKWLFEKGEYTYDPKEYHGPTLYYFALPSIWISGAKSFAETTEFTYRIIPVLFSALLIFFLLAIGDGLGRGAAVIAGVLTAISPAVVFYSRYFVQEMLLVSFTFLAIAAGWRYTQKRRLVWAILCAAGLGLMHATKETCIIAFASMAGAIVVSAFWCRVRGGRLGDPRALVHLSHIICFAAVAMFVSVLFFSSFFHNARGPFDSIVTYVNYLKRAHGAGIHDHPWHYYIHMLLYTKYAAGPVWSEALIVLLAVVGLVATLARRGHEDGKPGNAHFQRFIAFYTLFMTVIYSTIGYKTPWCMLGFLHGMILLAGIGAMALLRITPAIPAGPAFVRAIPKALACLTMAAAAYQLGCQSYRTNFDYYDDPRNPYAYAHAVSSVKRIAERAEDIAALHPHGHEMLIRVVKPDADYWPLPWYLRAFSRVGYWTEIPEDVDAPMIITSPELSERIDPLLKKSYQKEYYGLRPSRLLRVYIRSDLWEKFIAERTRQSDS